MHVSRTAVHVPGMHRAYVDTLARLGHVHNTGVTQACARPQT